MAETNLVRGKQCDPSSTTFKLAGKPYSFMSCDWDEKKTPGKVPGNHPQHRGRTRGKYEASMNFKLSLNDSEDFEADLAQTGPVLDTEFESSLAYDENGRSHFVEFVSVLITERKSTENADGSDGSAIEYSCDVYLIRKNGRDPIANAKK
jgi:hypothetical protein